MRGAGIEPLLRGCRVRQRHADLARARQSTIEIRLVQLDAEARIDGAPDLARARRSRYYALADRPRRMVARLDRLSSSRLADLDLLRPGLVRLRVRGGS